MANFFTGKTVGASPLDFLAPDIAQGQRQLDRRQQLADLLLAQAVQPADTGTQSVGGWAVPNNQIKPFEKLGMALLSRRSQGRIDEQRADLAKRYAEALSSKTGSAASGAPGKVDQIQAAALAALGVPEAIIAESVLGPKTRPVTVNRGNQTEVIMVPERGTGALMPSYSAPVAPTPDALLRDQTARRGQDMTQDTTLRGQEITMRGQDLTRGTALRGQDITAETALALGRPEVKAAQTEATETARAAVERGEKQRQLDASFSTYETAVQGLMEGLESADTGALMGRLPAMTANQQKAEGAVSAMAPVLKDLFRSAGEGVFTDRDQELLLNMIPQRTDYPEARKFKLENIDRIVRAKLKQGSAGASGQWAPADGTNAEDPLGLR